MKRIVWIVFLWVVGAAPSFNTNSQSFDTQILYFTVNENDSMNLWLVDLSRPTEPEQLTYYDEPGIRIFDYFVTNDGSAVVYGVWSTVNRLRGTELIRLNLQTREPEQLVECGIKYTCDQFAMSPNGNYIVYYWTDIVSLQVRLIDFTTSPYSEILIDEFARRDSPYHIALPQWVGNTSYFTYNLPIPFNRRRLPPSSFVFQLYNAESGVKGDVLPIGTPRRSPFFSPDASRYAYYESEVDIYPRTISVRQTENPEEVFSRYSLSMRPMRWNGANMRDWHSDNQHLLISDSWLRHEPETSPYQADLAILDTNTGTIEKLTNDPDYSAYSPSWNSDESLILFQRAKRHLVTESYCYCDQITIYDMSTREVIPLPIFGSSPKWRYSSQ